MGTLQPPHTDGPAALKVENLNVTFGSNPPALVDASMVIGPGEFVAIAGPNGGGKTTLLRASLGLVRRTAGNVSLFGEPLDQFSDWKRIGYLRQRAIVGVEAPVTVGEVVAAGRLPRTRKLGPLRPVDKTVISEALDRVGLAGEHSRQVRTMSGGQQQRVFLAKLLAGEPSMVFLDEPTTGVDHASQEKFAELLCDLNTTLGMTILYVSHEFGAVESHVDRLVLVNGGISYDGPPSDLPGLWHDPSHPHADHPSDRGCEHGHGEDSA